MKLSWQRRRLHLRHAFNIARTVASSSTDKQVLIVRIDHDGAFGLGEAAPVSYYHQSHDSAEKALAAAADALGDDPFAFDAVHERLWKLIPDQSATIAAIDGAMHDLAGKLMGLPVWRWLGLDRSRTPLTSFTIGIDSLDVMRAKVREATDFPILKVKIGTPDDRAILQLIRDEAPDKLLRVDANCGWKPDELVDRVREAIPFGLELIEQPTPRGQHDTLPATRQAAGVPLIADESCIDLPDVLACAGSFDGINIKLSKCGGIRPALGMIHTARAAGLKVMLGCMVETSVGIAAAAHLAPLVDYIDLDGHLLLADDPFEGIGGDHGVITLGDKPGLGVTDR